MGREASLGEGLAAVDLVDSLFASHDNVCLASASIAQACSLPFYLGQVTPRYIGQES